MKNYSELCAMLAFIINFLCISNLSAQTEKIRVAAIGDSNTAAYGTTEPSYYAWPVRLGYQLGGSYQVTNFGVSGATLMDFPDPQGAWTNDVESAYSRFKTYDSNIILIALGANDSKTAYWASRGATFVSQYCDFIDLVKSYSTSPPEIYLVTPVIALSNPFTINNANIINGVVPGIQETAAQKMVNLVDWYAMSRDWTTTQMPDGVHANNDAELLMAKKVLQIMQTPRPVITEGSNNEWLYDEYRWYKDGVLIKNANSPTYTTKDAANYSLSVKLTGSARDMVVSLPYNAPKGVTLCVANSAIETNFGKSVAGITINANRIELKGIENGATIFDCTGHLAKTVPPCSNFTDISGLSSGIYILKAGEYSRKFIKQ